MTSSTDSASSLAIGLLAYSAGTAQTGAVLRFIASTATVSKASGSQIRVGGLGDSKIC